MNQQHIADLSAELIMRYYDNDYMPFLEAMDDDALWYGPAEGQFLHGRETMIRVWSAEEHSLRFTLGNMEVMHTSAHPSFCDVMLSFHVTTHYPDNHDITYENAQARIRTLILMDLANELNGLVVGTGDLSELALGWCTYNGDQMSMYSVNAGIPKTLVRYLVKYAAENLYGEPLRSILLDVVDTPVSPELLPTDENGEIAQKTEDKVGPYELHDFFLFYFMRFGFTREKIKYMACQAFEDQYDAATIDKWLNVFMRRFCTQQFKRTAMPDGPKVVSVSLSPRGDWRMPSDATCI